MGGEFGGSKAKTRFSSTSRSSSGGGFFVGIALFIASFPLLFWNEGSAVKTAKALEEGKGIVVSLPQPVPESINEGKLVHFTGMAKTNQTLQDSLTGITVKAIKLRRISEMFQWKERKEEKDDRTDYYYDKVWSESLINSNSFYNKSYSNPSQMKVTSETAQVNNVTVGEFVLSYNLIDSISTASPIILTEEDFRNMPRSLQNEAKLSSGGLYYGANPGNSQIGDIRVRLESCNEQNVSVVAKQQSGIAGPYTTTNGRTLELLYPGIQTAEQIFAAEETANMIFTWMVRGGGVLMMYIGLMMSIGKLSRLFSWIPLLGSIVESGVAIMVGLMTMALSFMVISFAWIFYRPMIGGGLLLISAVAIYLIISKSRGSSEQTFSSNSGRTPPPPPLPE